MSQGILMVLLQYYSLKCHLVLVVILLRIN
jgi:hypothetical protein